MICPSPQCFLATFGVPLLVDTSLPASACILRWHSPSVCLTQMPPLFMRPPPCG